MDRAALHVEIRNALSLSDELSRHEHARGDDALADVLAAFRSLLADLEREVGQTHGRALPAEVDPARRVGVLVAHLRARRGRVPRALARRLRALVSSGERVARGLERPGDRVPSKSVLGLPLARIVPQDVHSFTDYAVAALHLASARVARTEAARSAGLLLGTTVLASALVSDDRAAPAKLLPIELHVVVDGATGVVGALAPFLLGYARRDPLAAGLQVAAGISTLALSLVTDYRASAGLTRPLRSRGGPPAPSVSGPRDRRVRVRVPEVQRALEGLSSAPTDWRPDASDELEEMEDPDAREGEDDDDEPPW